VLVLYDPRMGETLDARWVDGLARGRVDIEGASWRSQPDALEGGALSGVPPEVEAAVRCGCGRPDVRVVGEALVTWFIHGLEGDLVVACPRGHFTTWTWDAITPGVVDRAVATLAALGLDLRLEAAARTHTYARGPAPDDPLYQLEERVRTFAANGVVITRRLAFRTNQPAREMDWFPSFEASLSIAGIPSEGGPLVLRQTGGDPEAVSVWWDGPPRLVTEAEQAPLLEAWRGARPA
jgi:hypothetical protein